MEIFKIIGVGLLICIISIIIKQIKPEFYLIILLAGGAIMVLMLAGEIKKIIDYFLTIFSKTNLELSLFSSILKILGVGYITEFASSICVDSGCSSIGDKIAIAGKIIILYLSLPVITNLLNIIIDLL